MYIETVLNSSQIGHIEMGTFWLFPSTDFNNEFYQSIGNALFSQYIDNKLNVIFLAHHSGKPPFLRGHARGPRKSLDIYYLVHH